MSIRQILRMGWNQPRVSNYDAVKAAYILRRSHTRFMNLNNLLCERRAALRAANRRFRVHNGLSLKGA